jgi:hypothetical protein
VSGPITLEIDCMATARRILSAPDAVYSATPFEIVAMAACTVRESTGELPALPVIAGRPSELPASLAALLAASILAWDAYQANRLAAGPPVFAKFEDAFNTLKTHFEKEFPNGSDL